jgi:hypothetical protein
MATFKEFLAEERRHVVKDPEVEKMRSFIDKIAKMLFGHDGDYVRDLKRSKDYKYYGVAHEKSKLKTDKHRHLKLTFDNSTHSGEFEINTLSPLKIQYNGETDKKIRALYRTFEIKSKKRTNYIMREGIPVLREIHLGKHIDKHTVAFVKEVLKLLKPE